MRERGIAFYAQATRNGATREGAEIRAGLAERAWAALESRPAPSVPDFSGATNEGEAAWARLGGAPEDLRVVMHGSPEQAEAVVLALEAAPAGPEAVQAAAAEDVTLTAAELAILTRVAGGTDFVGVTTESEAKKRFAARQAVPRPAWSTAFERR